MGDAVACRYFVDGCTWRLPARMPRRAPKILGAHVHFSAVGSGVHHASWRRERIVAHEAVCSAEPAFAHHGWLGGVDVPLTYVALVEAIAMRVAANRKVQRDGRQWQVERVNGLLRRLLCRS